MVECHINNIKVEDEQKLIRLTLHSLESFASSQVCDYTDITIHHQMIWEHASRKPLIIAIQLHNGHILWALWK